MYSLLDLKCAPSLLQSMHVLSCMSPQEEASSRDMVTDHFSSHIPSDLRPES